VYPTISRDETPYSDGEASPEEEGYVVLHQAARLASTCRVFAPIYRQRTLTALLASLGGSDPPGGQGGDPFADVLDAFRTCMAEDNDGRGFVLVGHSQGAGLSAS
jgi:pimeloyl-ACP methyl ester carboxylesterase